jgi:hypothetical protein
MNSATPPPLAGFERRLLGELRAVVADGAAPRARDSEPAFGSRHVSRRWPVALAAAMAAGLLALAIAGFPFGGDESGRAWAVTSNADGSVTVEIDSLRDASGLQHKLRDVGVPAMVQYIPPGKACAAATAPAPRRGGPVPHGRADGPHQAGGRSTVRIETDSKGGIEFTVDTTAHPGETLVIRSQGLAPGQPPAAHPAATSQASAISIFHTDGVVRPCRLVDLPGG